MPYLKSQDRRKALDKGDKAQDGAERTYLQFKYFVDQWRQAPRFETAFRLQMEVYKASFSAEDQAAKDLAFHEFLRRYVDPHENAAMFRNGDV